MDVGELLTVFESAGSYAPFPLLFIVFILLGFAWLWLEYQITRVGRAVSAWHRPFPILAEISRISVWIIRISWILMWVWLVLYLILASSFWAVRNIPDYPVSLHRDLITIGHIWQQIYAFLEAKLLAPAPHWLKPSVALIKPAYSHASHSVLLVAASLLLG